MTIITVGAALLVGGVLRFTLFGMVHREKRLFIKKCLFYHIAAYVHGLVDYTSLNDRGGWLLNAALRLDLTVHV